MSISSFRPHPIPLTFVAGFALVFAVNGLMMWLAISSFSGLYSDHARDHGVTYNQIIAEQKARDALGWTVATSWQADAQRLEVSLTDASGSPLAGARVSVELVRPAEKQASIDVVLADFGNGRFGAKVDLPLRGSWDLDIAVDARGQHFAVTKRVFLQ
jgi:nitrogen fixation protein FixH